MPDAEGFAETNQHLSAADRELVLAEQEEDVAERRQAYVAELRQLAEQAAEQDEDFDPLLEEVAQCRAEMLAAEQRMRRLLAYAREFVRPQPYQLKELAHAAGLSISGVRIAYDEDEVRDVSGLTGDKPRRPWPEAQQ
jgi:hypothetical protein